MQRALSYAQSPALAVPLRFLLTAPCFAVLAGLLLMAYGAEAFTSRWAAPTLAVTHLLTLGVLSMAMAGSILQLIPVVAGQQLAAPAAAGAIAWLGLAVGTPALACAFLTSIPWLYMAAAGLLASGFLALLVAVGAALLRPVAPGARPMIAGMRLALPALCVTVALGIGLALTLGGVAQLAVLPVTQLHVAWGLVGWVALLVVSVAFQVIPMFQATPAYPALAARAAAPLLAALLLVWSALQWLASPIALAASALLALGLACFAFYSLRQIAKAGKQRADGTTWYWRLSLACLAASTMLHFIPAAQGAVQLALGILFICGFAMGAVNGMLYKIVPFLLWYHLQLHPHAKKGAVPSIRLILPERAGRRQCLAYALALAVLLLAVLWPQWLARPAGALLVYASVQLALDLFDAALRCRALGRSFQPS
jgi:hypothetical protein